MVEPQRTSVPESSTELGALSDPHQCHTPIDLPSVDREWLVDALRTMHRIRAVEEQIGDMVAAGRIRCPCHLTIGQEAIPVGVARHLTASDRVFGAHRSHGHYIALGGSVDKLMAEILGKDTGTSRGMGGSMHLIDRERGLFGTVPIVGATIPITVGAGLAAQMEGEGAVAVSFFGDGATEEGGFHESMNLASVRNLPVYFVCENNLFSSHLHIGLRQPHDSVSRFAEAHRIPWTRVDGNDVVAVAEAAADAVAAMRAGQGPQFLEVVTYRWRGHVGPREDLDVGVRRSDDLVLWKLRDPISRLAVALQAAGAIGADDSAQMAAEAKAEAADAWERAEGDPFPDDSALLDRVYGGPRDAVRVREA